MAKPGKWNRLLRDVPLVQEEPSYQARVDERKTEYADFDAVRLVKTYFALRDVKQREEEAISDVNLSIKAIEQLLIAAYTAQDISSLTVEDLGSVRVQPEPTVKVLDKEAFRQWCLANGFEREMTLHYQTAVSVMKTLLENGEPIPDCVEINCYTRVVKTGVKTS